ncbi:V-type ATP synthase subunit D [Myxococcota bacterium]|nr:V-type ATP synthase subunit D [Myxococcota bacterium]
MSEKVKLNKNSLREQSQSLKLFLEFLPTLELRKQQLQTEVRKAKAEITKVQGQFSAVIESARPWAGRLQQSTQMVRQILSVDEIKVETINVAGVKVPEFRGVTFKKLPYSLVATPWLFDAAVEFFEKAISGRELIRVVTEKHDLLAHELTKTTQRINLYEKVLIPDTRENIRKIKVYLGDQQTAAVCRAKIAKNKIVVKAMNAGH